MYRIIALVSFFLAGHIASFGQGIFRPPVWDTLSTRRLGFAPSNRGCAFDDLVRQGNGLFYTQPLGYMVFIMAPVFYGETDRDTVASMKEGFESFSPGPILNGTAAWLAAPLDARLFKTYKLTHDDQRRQTDAYRNFPIDLGAPSISGHPCAFGSSYVWSVFNDADTALSVYEIPARSFLEFQQIVAVTDSIPGTGADSVLSRTVIVRILAINKSARDFKKAYLGFWLDVDIGQAGFERFNIDTNRQMITTYVRDDVKNNYPFGDLSPALGVAVLQGPYRAAAGKTARFRGRTLANTEPARISAFERFLDDSGIGNDFYFRSVKEVSNFIANKRHDGQSWMDPVTGQAAQFPLTGDPVMRRGWWNDSSRYFTSGGAGFVFVCGPVALAPLDTQEIVIAVLVAKGVSSLDGVLHLRSELPFIRQLFDDGRFDCMETFYPLVKDIPPPRAYSFSLGQNYPNPAGADVRIPFSIGGEEGSPSVDVYLAVHDMLGRRLGDLVHETKPPGQYEARWNTTGFSSGCYMVKLVAGGEGLQRGLILMK